MIKLNDLLKLSEEQIKRTKIRFNVPSDKENPIELFKNNPDVINKKWLYWRKKKRYFKEGEIAICLVKIQEDKWLLTTIDTVETELNVVDGVNYMGEPLVDYVPYFGRTIISYHKKFQNSTRHFSDVIDELEVSQILPDIFDDDGFPGYDRVNLSYAQLKNIIERGKTDWISALENQKAVYLITDTNTGKLYVGKASAEEGMLLDRWKAYVKNGHGNNTELKRIVDTKGLDYIKKHFRYSILENYNAKVDDAIILKRESWWKEILQTRKFGNYNDN